MLAGWTKGPAPSRRAHYYDAGDTVSVCGTYGDSINERSEGSKGLRCDKCTRVLSKRPAPPEGPGKGTGT